MCCPFPPFIASALIHQGGTSIPELIVAAVNQIRSYDVEHKDGTNFTKADTHCQHVVNWLNAAMDDSIIEPVLAAPSIDPISIEKRQQNPQIMELLRTHNRHHNPHTPKQRCFHPTSNNVAEQTTFLQQLNNLTEQ